MPLLCLLAIGAIWVGVAIHENTCSKAPAHDSHTREEISKQMTGKSKKECAKILRRYRN